MSTLGAAVYMHLIHGLPGVLASKHIVYFLLGKRPKALLEGAWDKEDVGTGLAEEAEEGLGRLFNEEKVCTGGAEQHIKL